jgi:hypothetical protein
MPATRHILFLLLLICSLHGAENKSIDWSDPTESSAALKALDKNINDDDIKLINELVLGSFNPVKYPKRVMSPAGFEMLFRNSDLLMKITQKELVLKNIEVTNLVDLSNVEMKVPVLMIGCELPGGMKFRNAKLVGLNIKECKIGKLEGDGLEISNDLVLGPDTHMSGELRLPHAKIGGDLRIFEQSSIKHQSECDRSINLEYAEVGGQVHVGGKEGELNRTKLTGCIFLNGSSLGKLEFENTTLEKCQDIPDGFSILATSAVIHGPLIFSSYKMASAPWNRRGCETTGPLNFQGVHVEGSVHIEYLTISSNNNALTFEDSKVDGSMFLRFISVSDIKVKVGLDLNRLQLKGALEIEACSLRGKFMSLNGEGLECGGRVLLKNNNMKGECRLTSAHIKDNLEIQCGSYSRGFHSNNRCISLDGVEVGRSLNFDMNLDEPKSAGVKFYGLLSLCQARVGADLNFNSCNPQCAMIALDQSSASRFVFSEKLLPPAGGSNLDAIWPPTSKMPPQQLSMDGFTYQQVDIPDNNTKEDTNTSISSHGLTKSMTLNSKLLLELATTGKSSFVPQPYEHMAAVMRSKGHPKVALGILTEMSQNRLKSPDWDWGDLLWFGVFGRLIGYGYHPEKAFWLSVGWVIFASFVFYDAKNREWIQEVGRESNLLLAIGARSRRKKAPKPTISQKLSFWKRYFLQALPYSVEKFIPLLSLGLTSKWKSKDITVSGDNRGPIFIQIFIWFHIIIGWILASLWVGAITGLAK